MAPFIVLVGCTGAIDGGGGGGGGEDAGEPTLTLTSPSADSEHLRDVRGAFGALVAAVPVAADAGGPIVRVVYELAYELEEGALLAEVIGDELDYDAELDQLGQYSVVAIGYDADGVERARDAVSFRVGEPTPADCHAWLDLYGLEYTLGPNNQGVADPVTVTVPINGMSYRSGSSTSPRSTFFMDCSLALSLAKAAPELRRRDIIEVSDYGVYNYRCIGGGTPPDCPNGISQHAYAKGIDIAGLTSSTGTYYSVNDDWVIDPAGESTCDAATEGDKDTFLHEVICALKGRGVWNIVLTPNYNDAHRNHFHVDLTTGSDFIRFGDGVDVGPDLH